MSEWKHTPGPWAVTSSTGDIHSQARNGQNWIGQGPNPDAVSAPPESERIANAHLKAAAPELLAACEAIEPWAKSAGLNTDELIAAIAKAKGGAA